MYIIGGTIAAIPLLWRWWQDPPKGMHVQHSKHIADCSYPLKQELSTTRNNLNHPPWCMPPPEKESTIPTDARCHRSRRRLTVCVEGNIGSGKSTLLRGLQDARCTVYQEPVDDRWKPLLQAFYENPTLWSFPFQIQVLKWFGWLRDTVIRNPLPTSCGFQSPTAREGYTRKPEPWKLSLDIIERSPWAGFQIFSRNLHANGHLSTRELQLLHEAATLWGWTPDITIYIHTPWRTAHERVRKRGRECERDIPASLLQQLEQRHEEFIKWGPCGRVIRLDGTKGKRQLLQDALSVLPATLRKHEPGVSTRYSHSKIGPIPPSGIEKAPSPPPLYRGPSARTEIAKQTGPYSHKETEGGTPLARHERWIRPPWEEEKAPPT